MRTANIPSPLLPPRPVSGVSDAVFSTHEQHRDPQDTLPAQNDLGELNDVSLASTAAISAARSPISSEDDYVPSIIPHATEASTSDNAAENRNHDSLLQETGPLYPGKGIVSLTNHPSVQSVELDMIDNDSGNIDAKTKSGPDRSLSIADPNDSDDYEPPEPALTVEPSTEPSTLPGNTVFDEAKPLFPSSMSVHEPLSELIELSPALPVNGERSIVTAEPASPEEQTVRFSPARLTYLILLSGNQHACKPRNKLLRTLRKPAKEV